MAVAHSSTASARNSSVSSISVTLSTTPNTDDVVLVAVATRSNVGVTDVTGPGSEVGVSIRRQCGARGQSRLEVWKYLSNGASGEVVINLDGTATTVAASASIYTGEDATTPTPTSVSYNTLGSGGACSGGTDNDDATGTLTTTINNSIVYVAANTRNKTMANTSGYTNRLDDLAQGSGGDIITLSIEDKVVASAGATTVGAANNLSGVSDWELVAVEIAPPVVAGTAVPSGLMMVGHGV